MDNPRTVYCAITHDSMTDKLMNDSDLDEHETEDPHSIIQSTSSRSDGTQDYFSSTTDKA
jgi:hypothetical protein